MVSAEPPDIRSNSFPNLAPARVHRTKCDRSSFRCGGPSRRSRSAAAGERLDAAENKVETLNEQLEELERELADEVTQIDAEWMAVAKDVTTTPVTLERTDVKVVQMALVWIPVP